MDKEQILKNLVKSVKITNGPVYIDQDFKSYRMIDIDMRYCIEVAQDLQAMVPTSEEMIDEMCKRIKENFMTHNWFEVKEG